MVVDVFILAGGLPLITSFPMSGLKSRLKKPSRFCAVAILSLPGVRKTIDANDVPADIANSKQPKPHEIRSKRIARMGLPPEGSPLPARD